MQFKMRLSYLHQEKGRIPILTILVSVVIVIIVAMGIFFIAPMFFSTKPIPPMVVSNDTTATKPAIPSDQDFIAAVTKGDKNIAIKQLNQGAYVNARNQNGATALFIAAQNGNIDLVRALLDKNADVKLTNNMGMTALFPAAEGGRTEIARLLVDKGIDVNTKTNIGWTALMAAVNNGRKDSTRLLIEHGADVNAKTNDEKTVLSFAKRSEIIEMLKIAGASGPVVPDQYIARSKLQELGITYNKNSFLNCAREGKLEAVKYFLDAGMNPNTANKDGVTALMYVIYYGNAELVDMMIRKGADVNSRTLQGKTPLVIASENKKDNIVQILKSAGAME